MHTSFDLSSLVQGMAGITPAMGTMLAEAASVCLSVRLHNPGVTLSVDGCVNVSGTLNWSGPSTQALDTYNDIQEATEWGASAVAMVLVRDLLGQEVVQRAAKGEGHSSLLLQELPTGATEPPTTTITGMLKHANALEKHSQIKIKSESSKAPVSIIGPEGMDDIVRTMWDTKVTATAKRDKQKLWLTNIEPAE